MRTRAILEECAASGAPVGSSQQRIGDMYASFMDEQGIEARGLAPLHATLGRIAQIKDKHGLAVFFGGDLRADVDPLNNSNFWTDRLFGLWAEQDLNDPSRVAPYILQGGLGMPDRSYYLDATPSMEALRAKYIAYVTKLLIRSHRPACRQGRARLRARAGHREGARAARRLRGREEGEQPVVRGDFDQARPRPRLGRVLQGAPSSTRQPASSCGTRQPCGHRGAR